MWRGPFEPHSSHWVVARQSDNRSDRRARRRLPVGADEAVAEAGGLALVLGSGAEQASQQLLAATQAWWCDTGDGVRPGALAQALAGPLESVALVLLPASPDGRDLAPRLAAAMHRPLLAGRRPSDVPDR